ncbi:hypothetical protein ACFLUO_09730 [Chloroflexota bacterium]
MAASDRNESPEERFTRMAEIRTNAILDKLRLLGNLSNKRVYGYSEQDVKKIFSIINKQIKEERAKFNPKKPERFKL